MSEEEKEKKGKEDKGIFKGTKEVKMDSNLIDLLSKGPDNTKKDEKPKKYAFTG